MLRTEVGALGANHVKNMRGVARQARISKAPVWVGVGISAPAGPLTDFFFELGTVHVFSWWWALWCHWFLIQAASNPAQAHSWL